MTRSLGMVIDGTDKHKLTLQKITVKPQIIMKTLLANIEDLRIYASPFFVLLQFNFSSSVTVISYSRAYSRKKPIPEAVDQNGLRENCSEKFCKTPLKNKLRWNLLRCKILGLGL